MTGCFSLLWGHSSEALAARKTGCCLLYQVLAQQVAPVLPHDPYEQPLGETQCTRGGASSSPAALLAGLTPATAITVQTDSQPFPRPATQMGRSHPWPVPRSSPIHPGSQVPMVTPLRCRDDHHPRPTLVPGPGMRSTHSLSEIGFPGL